MYVPLSHSVCVRLTRLTSYLGVNPAVSGFLLFAEPVTETHTSFSHVKWSESSRRLQCVVTFQEVVRPLTLLVVNFKHFYKLISTCCSWHHSQLEMWTSFPAGGCLFWLGVWLWSWDWLSPQHFTFNSVSSPRSTFYCTVIHDTNGCCYPRQPGPWTPRGRRGQHRGQLGGA